ncbi:unnamed protein product [Phytomonas sp. Hart1]|nr:unnamed protein product [Phytomonas sp. Hart1]|eukprot:CCW69090.1 unnamed protein product [Phytomonas sp. isolate Hart1]
MGSRSKPKQKRRRYLNCSDNKNLSEAVSASRQKGQSSPLNLSSLPVCVQKLQSTDWAELEEACRDICYFALRPKHHANFLQAKVPLHLSRLLFFPSSVLNGESSQLSTSSLQRDVIYTQIAVAETLRNLITNSQEDEVLDLLTSGDSSECNSCVASVLLPPITDFARLLGDLLRNVYLCVKEAHQGIDPHDCMLDNDDENENGNNKDNNKNNRVEPPLTVGQGNFTFPHQVHNKKQKNNQSRNYLLLLALLEEILRLLTVSLEATTSNTTDFTTALKRVNGCLCITEVFSLPETLHLLLEILEGSASTAWENLHHPAGYFSNFTSLSQGAFPGNDGSVLPPEVPRSDAVTIHPMMLAFRTFKQEETKRLASIASATADVFYALSPGNATMATFLGQDDGGLPTSPAGSSLSASQVVFLEQVVEAAQLRGWWEGAPEGPSLMGSSTPTTALSLTWHCLHGQLLQMTLALQGALLQARPGPELIRRVLPTLTGVLQGALPLRLWRGALPLLLADGPPSRERREGGLPDEACRTAGVGLVTGRLRCALAAMRAFQALTEALCRGNPPDPGLDDDVAFARNPHAALLRESGGLHVFGLLLQDILGLERGGTPTQGERNEDVVRRRELHLLREAAQSNAEVTTLQFLILSIEVVVWGTASVLLLMVPVESLGDPTRVWWAILRAVEQRYGLLVAANTTTNIDNLCEEDIAAEEEGGSSLQPSNIAAESSSARHLLWIQLESLVQMLWTLQRKQARTQGGVLHSSNERLRTEKREVDLFIRLAWERREAKAPSAGKSGEYASSLCVMPSLTQACVGTVGLLCTSFREVEATLVGARFAITILTRYESDRSVGSTSSLLQLDGGVLLSGKTLITNPTERKVWQQKLFTVDSIVSVRAEAANTLMDFFLDERFDKDVYVPEGIHKNLSSFLSQLREYIKQRLMINKFWKHNYQDAVEPDDLEQWQEIAENLDGFLDYKEEHIRDLRKH